MYWSLEMSPQTAMALPPLELILSATCLALAVVCCQLRTVRRTRARQRRTLVDISYNDACTLVGEETCYFCTDTLTGSGDDCDLASQHTLGVVQVGGDLLEALRHGDGDLDRYLWGVSGRTDGRK